MERHTATATKEIKITEIPYIPDPTDELVRIIEQHIEESKINLKGASIIVSGGYGLGTRENFKLIYDLAHTTRR